MGVHKKYFSIDWGYPIRYRRYKIHHNRRASSIYIQVLWLEVVVWYR